MKDIISQLTHELRNPLTTLYSTVQFIEFQHPEVKNFKYWNNLSNDIEYMEQLIKNVSSFADFKNPQKELFSLHTLLERVSLSFAAMLSMSGVEFTSKIDPSIHQIIGDRTKLQEVFLNLLKNAYEASLPDKAIFLDATANGDSVTIQIRDTGCGISSEQLPTIFDRFVSYKKNGTGLGLSICKQIVEAHGGSISVESTLGAGTCFSVSLPITK